MSRMMNAGTRNVAMSNSGASRLQRTGVGDSAEPAEHDTVPQCGDGPTRSAANMANEANAANEARDNVDQPGPDAPETPVVDNPCWGSPTQCSLADLLRLTGIRKETSILFEDNNVIVLNKPPDLRMDGPYPATVHKLLTYWYPAPSILQCVANAMAVSSNVTDTASATMSAIRIDTASSSRPRDADVNDPTVQQALLELVTTRYHLHSDCPDCPLRPCHQLDYATSGVLLVARHKAAAATARRIWEDRCAGLTKVYTAVLLGHVHVPNGQSSTVARPHWPVVAASELQSTVARMEQAYRKSRHALHKAQHLPGYVPVYSLFQQWNHQQDKRHRQTALQPQHLPTQSPRFKKCKPNAIQSAAPSNVLAASIPPKEKGTSKGSDMLSSDEWKSVWQLLQTLTSVEYDMARTTKWKQLKKFQPATQHQTSTHAMPRGVPCKATECNADICGTIIAQFEQAAIVYNQLLQAKLHASAPLQHVTCSDILFELPPLFCVSPDASVDKAALETFYICAPLAQLDNEFAMRIHPKSLEMQCSIPQSEVEWPTSNGRASHEQQHYYLPVGNADLDNFKPSLTKCTVLHQTYIAPPAPLADKVPVTLVQMQPLTGRRHQLRVHAAFVGHAMAGDCTYACSITKTRGLSLLTPQATAEVLPEAMLGPTMATRVPACHPLAEASIQFQQKSRSLVPRLCLHSTMLTVPGLLDGRDLTVESESPFKMEEEVLIITDR